MTRLYRWLRSLLDRFINDVHQTRRDEWDEGHGRTGWG